jgi:hypothetical protein
MLGMHGGRGGGAGGTEARELTVWERYQARLPAALRDPEIQRRTTLLVPRTLAAMEASLRDERRALQQELVHHERRVSLQKASRHGFASALGAMEAVGAMLAPPPLHGTGADFARIAKARARQRLAEATVAVAASCEYAKRQALLRKRAAALEFARNFIDRVEACSAAEIRQLHDDAQAEFAATSAVCSRLGSLLSAVAGAKQRWQAARGLQQFADDPGHGGGAQLFGADERAQLAREAEFAVRACCCCCLPAASLLPGRLLAPRRAVSC